MPTIHYMPREGGGYQPYAKLPYTGEPAIGKDNLALTERGSKFLSVVDAQGNQQFTHPAEDYIQSVQYQPGADRYLVQDWGGIQAISARTGELQGSIHPENHSHQSSMHVLSDGRLALNVATWSEHGQLLMLQPDLTPSWNQPTALLRARFLELPQGQLAAFDGSNIEVRDSAGKVLHKSDHAVNDPILSGSKLAYVETTRREYKAGRVAEQSNSRRLCLHDLTTGKTSKSPTSNGVEMVSPLKDGRFLLSERSPGCFAIAVHGAEGKLVKRVKLPEEAILGQVELSADGRSAFVVEGDLQFNTRVHRLDLQTFALKQIFETKGDAVVSALSDGRTAIFSASGVELVEDGSKFGSLGELLEALPPGTVPANERITSRTTNFVSFGEGPGKWDRLMLTLTHRLKLDGPARLAAEPGKPFTTGDYCLNFTLPALDALPAAVAAAVQAPTVSDLFRQDGGLPKWARHEPHFVEVTDPEGNKHSQTGDFKHVLPLMAEGRPVVAAAGEHDTRLWWWDPKRISSSESYELEDAISAIQPGQDGRSVVATTEGGGVLHLYPQQVGNLAQEPRKDPAAEPGGNLGETSEGIRLPGVFIRRYRGS